MLEFFHLLLVNLSLTSLDDSFVDFLLLVHLPEDLPDDRMPHKHQVCCRDDNQLNNDEITNVKSPVRVDHEWRKAVDQHAYHEDKTLIKEF